MALFTAIAGAIATAAGALGVTGTVFGIATTTVIGYAGATAVYAGVIFGGVALSGGGGKPSQGLSSSPSYSRGGLKQTQTDIKQPVGLIYGKVKLAGNKLWQKDSGGYIKRLISLGDGEINSITGVKLNNHTASSVNATVNKYYGDGVQTIDSMVDGSTNSARAKVVGGLKHLAYVAISVKNQQKIKRNYNFTALVEGRKIKVYSDVDTYTVEYSNNPAWILLDLLTSYNGLGLCLDSDGTLNDARIQEEFDIQSFINAAEYCDGNLSFYLLETALSGANNDLVWKSKKEGDNNITITYIDPETSSQSANIEIDASNNITVNLATDESGDIITTANDIANLATNNPDIDDLIKIQNAEDNDGSGVVTAMPQTSLQAGESKKRFEFNFIFDSSFSIMDAIEEVKKSCNGALVRKGAKKQFKIDKPESTSQVITADMIITGSESYKTIPMKQRYDIQRVEYVSPDHEWAHVKAHVERDTTVNTPPTAHTVDILGVTNFNQASRLGWIYLNRNVYCLGIYTFATGMETYDREIGDVINVEPYTETKTGSYLTSDTTVTGSSTSFTSDFTVGDLLWSHQEGEAREITEITSDTEMVLSSSFADDVTSDTTKKSLHHWILGHIRKQFKITSLLDDHSGIFELTAREYNPLIYNDQLGTIEPEVTVNNVNNIYAVPSDVENFSASIYLDSLILGWDENNEPNVTYEIREGNSWENSQTVAKGVTGLTETVKLFSTGSKTYFIKAISENGVYSENASAYNLTISGNYIKNNVASVDLTSYGTPTFYDCKEYNGSIKPEVLSTSLWENNGGQVWEADSSKYYSDSNLRWTYNCKSSGYMETSEIDVGQDLDNEVFIDYNFYDSGDEENSVKFYWKYKTSTGSYQTEWQEFFPGKYEFRYCLLKIEFSNPNNVLSVLNNPKLTIDVPDREEKYKDVSVGTGGTTITFETDSQSIVKRPFVTDPTVIIQPQDNSINISATFTTTDKKVSITIYLYDKNDNPISGVVDCIVKGY